MEEGEEEAEEEVLTRKFSDNEDPVTDNEAAEEQD
jgi:hypothetical protein